MSVRLQIISGETIILDSGSDENLLFPLTESERLLAFQALSEALALLAGVMPAACDSTVETGVAAAAQDPAREPPPQSGGEVVMLSERRSCRGGPLLRPQGGDNREQVEEGCKPEHAVHGPPRLAAAHSAFSSVWGGGHPFGPELRSRLKQSPPSTSEPSTLPAATGLSEAWSPSSVSS